MLLGNKPRKFGPDIEVQDDYNIEINIKPTQFINNKVYINSIANLFISVLFDSENIKSSHKHTLEYVLNELVTNAVKYSILESEITISALKIDGKAYFKIHNTVNEVMFNIFEKYLVTLYSSDPEDLFQKRINSLCSFIDVDIINAGIGVMTLINDYSLPLSYEINKTDDDKFLVTTKFFWES